MAVVDCMLWAIMIVVDVVAVVCLIVAVVVAVVKARCSLPKLVVCVAISMRFNL